MDKYNEIHEEATPWKWENIAEGNLKRPNYIERYPRLMDWETQNYKMSNSPKLIFRLMKILIKIPGGSLLKLMTNSKSLNENAKDLE